MKIAILGAGFAGLATAWHLLDTPFFPTVHLFDPEPIGNGPSGLSSGLLHAHSGLHARFSWNTYEGIQSTLNLLEIASQFCEVPIFKKNGVLRPAITQEHVNDFIHCSKKFSDVIWWNHQQCLDKISGLNCLGGLYIPEGISIDVKNYLNGLYLACQKKGATFFQQKIENVKDLSSYDVIICALGYATRKVKGFDHLPVNPIKGQLIELEWPKNQPPLPFSLVSVGYLTMQGTKTCIAGATFERDFSHHLPDPQVAIPDILSKVTDFLPFLKEAKVIGCKAGIRASSDQSHLPIVDKVASKLWCITALGSKGLLYHSLLAKHLAEAIIHDDPSLIPKEVKIKPKKLKW